MNQLEVEALLKDRVGRYKRWCYAELVQLLNHHEAFEMTAASGAGYQFELQVQWDDRPSGRLRVSGSVHDDDARDIDLLTGSFIVQPETRTY